MGKHFEKIIIKNINGTDTQCKFCIKCREYKTFDDFYKRIANKDGMYSYCKDCTIESQRDTPEKRKKIRENEIRRYYEYGYTKIPKKTYNRDIYLKQMFGIDQVFYENLLKSQDNRCGICEVLITSNKEGNIDHCHTTGKIRGILCPSCNKGLGNFKDNDMLLLKAINYIEEAKVSLVNYINNLITI